MALEAQVGEMQRALGRVEGQIQGIAAERRARDDSVDERLDRIEAEQHAMRAQLGEIRDLLAQGRGGWKVLVAAGAIAGMVAGWVIPTFLRKLLGL